MSDRDPETGEHTPMDAGAWRARALRAERHCDALEVDRLIHQRDRAERRAATYRAELADLRAELEALRMVATVAGQLARRLRAYGVPGYVAVVLVALEDAIDALGGGGDD